MSLLVNYLFRLFLVGTFGGSRVQAQLIIQEEAFSSQMKVLHGSALAATAFSLERPKATSVSHLFFWRSGSSYLKLEDISTKNLVGWRFDRRKCHDVSPTTLSNNIEKQKVIS